MKKTIVKLIAVLALCFMVGAVLVACKAEAGPQGEKGDKGDTGATGATGAAGANGLTPEIKDGYWWIGETNTGVKAQGNDGAPAPVCAEHDNTNHVLKSTKLKNHKDADPKTCEIVLSVCNECGFAAINVECDHNYEVSDDTTKTYPATCSADGLETKICEGCGDTIVTALTERPAHTPNATWDPTNINTDVWTEGVPEAGQCACINKTPYSTKCKDCGADIIEFLQGKGHTITAWDDTKSVAENVEKGWKLAQKPANENVCEWAPVYVFECTCYNDTEHKNCFATKILTAPGHKENMTAPTCTEDRVCTICNKVLATKTGHTHTSTSTWAVITAPTDEQVGAAEIYCNVCDAKCVDVVLPKLGTVDEVNMTDGEYKVAYTNGTACSELNYVYTYTYVNENDETVKIEITFNVEADIEHSEVPALEDCVIREEDGLRYYMYECKKCGIFIVVKVEPIV